MLPSNNDNKLRLYTLEGLIGLLANCIQLKRHIKTLHSGTIVLNCVMFMFRSGGLGNSVIEYSTAPLP